MVAVVAENAEDVARWVGGVVDTTDGEHTVMVPWFLGEDGVANWKGARVGVDYLVRCGCRRPTCTESMPEVWIESEVEERLTWPDWVKLPPAPL